MPIGSTATMRLQCLWKRHKAISSPFFLTEQFPRAQVARRYLRRRIARGLLYLAAIEGANKSVRRE
jgi:hypothetical protein